MRRLVRILVRIAQNRLRKRLLRSPAMRRLHSMTLYDGRRLIRWMHQTGRLKADPRQGKHVELDADQILATVLRYAVNNSETSATPAVEVLEGLLADFDAASSRRR